MEISTGVYAIRAKYGLYSNDWISAKGANPDAGGVVSGATDLDDLSDVTLTNMQNGQVLAYNGSQWVNKTLEAGLDETALAQYLTDNGYATQSWVTSQKYLTTVSIATITDLHSSWDALLKSAPTAYVTRWPAWSEVTSKPTWIGANKPSYAFSEITGKPTTLGGYGITDGVNAVSVTGSGNAVTTANVSGHTLTLTKGSTFALTTGTNASGTWPISITGDAQTFRGYGTNSTWGGVVVVRVDGVAEMGRYIDFHYADDDPNDYSIRLQVPNVANQLVVLPSSSGTIALTTSNVYSATKLQTARKIWGQSFNGEADVSGALSDATTITASGQIQGGSFKLGSGTITWDATNNCFHFSHGLYSDSFVSAKGANSGSGGTVGGVTKLSDLSDVQLGTLATNQVLSWNGSKWVNKTLDMGLDETALAQYLTNNQYLTMPTGDGRYVKKAGDIMTGDLGIRAGASTIDGSVPYAGSASASNIDVADLSNYKTLLGAITMGSNIWYNIISIRHRNGYGDGNRYGMYIRSQLTNASSSLLWGKQSGGTWGAEMTILDSSNYAATLDTRYVKKSGDTMTGGLTVPSLAVSGSTATVAGNKVWHAGNDGSGSGLDADLLDGYHGSSSNTTDTYVLRNSKAGALVNEITFPLVNFPKDDPPRANISPMSLRVWDSYNQSVVGGDMYGTVLEFCARQSHWNHQLYFQAFGHNIWHRASSYHDSSWTYGWVKLATVNDNVYSATQLQTARTINGTAFNGTSNIVTSYWGTARTLSLTGNATGSVSMNGSSNVSMSVNVNYATSAGNADTLDGFHANAGNAPYGKVAVVATDGVLEIGRYIDWHYSNSGTGDYSVRFQIPNVSNVWVNMPSASGTLARTVDNVASASRLQTSQTIWGRPFDGTAPVSGDMTGVGKIFSSLGNATLKTFYATNSTQNGITNETFCFQSCFDGQDGETSSYTSTYSSRCVIALQPRGGNVGIGTTSPSYKLHVAGTGYFSGALSTSSSFTANSYICSNEGWFQNNKTGCGLYNSAQDARWYANSSGWISDKKINATAGLAVTGAATFSSTLTASGIITANSGLTTSQYIQIGSARLMWDSETGALYVLKSDGTACGFYATGFVSAKGANGDGRPGDLTDVDSLTFTPGASNRNLYFNANGMRIITTNSGNWATGISVYNNANTTQLGDVCGAYGGENSFSYSYFGGSYNSPGMVILPSNKYVGIGTTSPTYKLHVSGTAYATGGFQNGSDIRYKHVLQDLALTVAQVAAAPSFLFRWTDGTADGVQAGTSAQYWQQVMPQVVTESAGRLSMQYDKAALAAAITIAREMETLEQRVDRLEKENGKLKKKVKELERRAA